jgi:hypothetical protein
MNECPHRARFKPLPLRRGFWRDLPNKLKEGIVLLPETVPEIRDTRAAAHAVIIDHMQPRLIQNFVRPLLSGTKEFYGEFFMAYLKASYRTERRIWEEIAREFDQAIAENPLRELTAQEAAYLTLVAHGYKTGPQSMELYMNLASYARAYEGLLRDKYGDWFTGATFYKALRAHMPKFLSRLIGLDAVILNLVTINLTPRKHRRGIGFVLRPSIALDARLLDLGENDSLSFPPKFLHEIHKLAKEVGFKTDLNGRTEDRGCPVLFADEYPKILSFAIEELIAQHQLYFGE